MLPRGFHDLIGAQFTSALADNALLIVTMALLQSQGHAAWWAPLLKFSFTLSYVLLAPVVGPLADAVPKAQLMAWMNAVKVVGVVLLFAGVHPLLGYGVVGLGAAAYAPAKYGLITELVPTRHLVVANGWIEVSVVVAALMGVLAGGALVSEPALAASRSLAAWITVPTATASHAAALIALWMVYGLAALLNLRVPDSGVRYAQRPLAPRALVRDFAAANRRLWSDPAGSLSLAVTTLFWGVGATLQFAVLKWAVEVLGLTLEKAAYLQGAVAVGVMAGAAWAGRAVPLAQATRVLPAGVLLGLLFAATAATRELWLALLLLVATGIVGGVLVVPMNALLQHRGFALLTAGRSIAVQGFNENLSILLMLAGYAALLALEVPLLVVMGGLGLGIAVTMGALIWHVQRAPARGSRLEP